MQSANGSPSCLTHDSDTEVVERQDAGMSKKETARPSSVP